MEKIFWTTSKILSFIHVTYAAGYVKLHMFKISVPKFYFFYLKWIQTPKLPNFKPLAAGADPFLMSQSRRRLFHQLKAICGSNSSRNVSLWKIIWCFHEKFFEKNMKTNFQNIFEWFRKIVNLNCKFKNFSMLFLQNLLSDSEKLAVGF